MLLLRPIAGDYNCPRCEPLTNGLIKSFRPGNQAQAQEGHLATFLTTSTDSQTVNCWIRGSYYDDVNALDHLERRSGFQLTYEGVKTFELGLRIGGL